MQTFKTEQEAIDYSMSNPSETVELKLIDYKGQLRGHRFYVNGKLHGEYKWYFSNGQLRGHRFYVNGKLHGESKSYYDEGQLSVHSFYVDGNMHGEFKLYWSDGQLEQHCFYVNNEEINVDHLRDGSYKSRCVLITLFDGNVIDEDI